MVAATKKMGYQRGKGKKEPGDNIAPGDLGKIKRPLPKRRDGLRPLASKRVSLQAPAG